MRTIERARLAALLSGVAPPGALDTFLSDHGFSLHHTGGNCTAWGRDDVEVCDDCRANGPHSSCDCRKAPQIEELIVRADEASAPRNVDQLCHVYTRDLSDGADERTNDWGEPTTATLSAILIALADPRDEYTLLDQRLHNGYGHYSNIRPEQTPTTATPRAPRLTRADRRIILQALREALSADEMRTHDEHISADDAARIAENLAAYRRLISKLTE